MPNEHSEGELKQQALIDSLSNKVQQLVRNVQDSDSEKLKAMFDMLLEKMKTPEWQRHDGDARKQQTKIERPQEKIQELETRNHCIIERARDSVPTPKRRPRPAIEVQRVPHPGTDGSTTLPWPSPSPSAAGSCPPQVPSGPTGGGGNNMTACPTQADDDCSLPWSRRGTATCAVPKKQKFNGQRSAGGFLELPQH